ncbi:MAG TPA: hypothetical protein VGG07_25130 [Solirubrobacteraceae bacterium]
MPNVTIYVPRDLHEQIRVHDVAISRTCQNALKQQVRLAARGVAIKTGTAVNSDRDQLAQHDPAGRST